MSKSTMKIITPAYPHSESFIAEQNTEGTFTTLLEGIVFAGMDGCSEFHLDSNTDQYNCTYIDDESTIKFHSTYENDTQVVRDYLQYSGDLKYAKDLAHDEHHELNEAIEQVLEQRIAYSGRTGFLKCFNELQ